MFYVAQKLLLTTGKVASINMVNGDLVPVSGGGPAGGGMAAANSLKTSGDDSDSDSGEIVVRMHWLRSGLWLTHAICQYTCLLTTKQTAIKCIYSTYRN